MRLDMRNYFMLVALLFLQAFNMNATDRRLASWTLSREGDSSTYAATVPATVAGVLADCGYWGKDVLWGGNYFDIDKSIFDSAWTFKTSFDAAPKRGKFYTIRFDGLGFYADIDLNGQRIASSDTTWGVFVRRSYDVTDLVTKKGNSLSVMLRRAQSGDLNVGYVDWNPRPVDESMGILRDVVLKETGAVAIEDVLVKTDLDTQDFSYAFVNVTTIVRNLSSKPVNAWVSGAFESGKYLVPVSLRPFETKEVTATVKVSGPRVWWSHDLGKPELYTLETKVMIGKKISDTKSQDFGIRSITSYLKDGKYRQFVLNGVPVLVKGAGWTDEIFMRDTHESIATQVALVKDMGLNCIRFENIWGKDSFVYDECDRQGILVLAGFSCQWEWEDYCGLKETKGFGCINDSRSMDTAVKYFHDQVLWMYNHPSLIAWLTGSDRIPNKDLEERYMQTYEKYEYRPYVCSAKGLKSEYGGLSGFKMEGPYEYVGPEYWFIDKNRGGAYGFNSETGIGANIPQVESMARMMPADSLWPISKSWNQHCTASSSAMNTPAILVREVEGQYGVANELGTFMSRAHMVDYDGTRAMFEAFRVNAPEATGVIQWMLNSAWPSIYWQLYDYYMVPTAGYYGTKKACAAAQLILDPASRKVYGISDYKDMDCEARMRVYDVDSRLILDSRKAVEIGNNSLEVFALPQMSGGYVALELLEKDGQQIASNFYCIPVADTEYDWKHSNWCGTPILKSRDLQFVVKANAAPTMSVKSTAGGYVVTLTNDSDRISYANRLSLVDDATGELIAPAFWSDNFVTVLPHESIEVKCSCRSNGTVKLDTLR